MVGVGLVAGTLLMPLQGSNFCQIRGPIPKIDARKTRSETGAAAESSFVSRMRVQPATAQTGLYSVFPWEEGKMVREMAVLVYSRAIADLP